MSTILPLPSSPHWAPTTTTAPIVASTFLAEFAWTRAPHEAPNTLGVCARQRVLGPIVDPDQTECVTGADQQRIVAPRARKRETMRSIGTRYGRRDHARRAQL